MLVCVVACSVPRARGLALGYTPSPASTRASTVTSLRTQGSRTRPGLHAVAREYAGFYGYLAAYPGLADSPWVTRRRPRVRGLLRLPRSVPRARGLALGYTPSPASTRASTVTSLRTQGSRTTRRRPRVR